MSALVWRAAFAWVASALLAGAPRMASACSVCTPGRDDETRVAFQVTTLFLTVLPLGLIGGVVWWLVRRARSIEQARAEASAGPGSLPGRP